MKYNISIKNVQVQNVASIEGAEINVEYGVGEIPEILGHVLPFIEKMAGEIAPKLANTFVDARLRLNREEEATRKERAEADAKSLAEMRNLIKELGANPKQEGAAMSFEQFMDERRSRTHG